ncbi:MAG: hypothetical protein R8K53_01705 [Mariprofundaceae bacterium]
MNQNLVKWLGIITLGLWLLTFAIDSMFGINWPSQSIHRAFIWFPSVIIGLYWLVYGGKRKTESSSSQPPSE